MDAYLLAFWLHTVGRFKPGEREWMITDYEGGDKLKQDLHTRWRAWDFLHPFFDLSWIYAASHQPKKRTRNFSGPVVPKAQP